VSESNATIAAASRVVFVMGAIFVDLREQD
jgi:hypothetical protein